MWPFRKSKSTIERNLLLQKLEQEQKEKKKPNKSALRDNSKSPSRDSKARVSFGGPGTPVIAFDQTDQGIKRLDYWTALFEMRDQISDSEKRRLVEQNSYPEPSEQERQLRKFMQMKVDRDGQPLPKEWNGDDYDGPNHRTFYYPEKWTRQQKLTFELKNQSGNHDKKKCFLCEAFSKENAEHAEKVKKEGRFAAAPMQTPMIRGSLDPSWSSWSSWSTEKGNRCLPII